MCDFGSVRHYTLDVNHADWQRDLVNIQRDIQMESDTFGERLRGIKNRNGMTALQTLLDYSGMNRDVVQRIRDNRTGKMITKRMALSMVIAAQTPKNLVSWVLKPAGYCLSPAILYDRIIMYFIEKEDYDFVDINQCLREFGFSEKYWLGSQETIQDVSHNIV